MRLRQYVYSKLTGGMFETLKNTLADDNKSMRWFHAEFIHPRLNYREFLIYINFYEEMTGVIETGIKEYYEKTS